MFQGISVDLSTLRAEWESRASAAAGGNPLSTTAYLQVGNNEGSSVSGTDVNEEIDVVGDSCSESGSERLDSAADGSVDGECYPRRPGGGGAAPEDCPRRYPPAGAVPPAPLNHQQDIHHWGLSLLERRRELVGLSQSGLRQGAGVVAGHDDDAQSASIDLSVKGRDERKRLNPFSIDSLLGNNNGAGARDLSTSPSTT